MEEGSSLPTHEDQRADREGGKKGKTRARIQVRRLLSATPLLSTSTPRRKGGVVQSHGQASPFSRRVRAAFPFQNSRGGWWPPR